MECYRYEVIKYENAPYKGIIDTVYVLTMDNSSRHKSVYSQLNKYKLTNNIKIVFNKGYKKCKKTQCSPLECKEIKTPPHDITHANNEILKDAIKNNYETILVLEDDFILSDKITDKKVIKDIRNIIQEKRNDDLVLKLGCLPFITLPYNSDFKRVFLSSGAHAVVYNSNVMRKMYNSKKFALNDYDASLNMHFYGRQLMYKEPLIYQLWTETENKKYWDDWNGGLLNTGEWYFSLIKKLQLNKQVEPGTSIVYKYNWIISSLFFLLMIIVSYYLGRVLYTVIAFYIIQKNYKKTKRKRKRSRKNRK